MINISYKKFLIFGIIVLFIGAAVAPNISGYDNKTSINSLKEAPSNFPLNDDFINAFWQFDECSGDVVEDSSTHNYDGTRYGATWITGGYSGCALDFDGVNDYVDLTSHVKKIAVNKTDDYIISFAFKSTLNSPGAILSMTGYKNVPEFRIELEPNGSLLFKIWTGLCGMVLYSEEDHNDGQWHEVEIFFSGITTDPTMWIYIDNNLDGELTDWLCDIENGDFTAATIGKRASEDTVFFDGTIDEFKFIKYAEGNEQEPPEIGGPDHGDPDVEYDFSFTTYDPEEDEVEIKIDWGDGDITNWLGPHDSGEEAIYSHTYDTEGLYVIKAKSQDFWDDSRWSNPGYEIRIGNQPPYPPTIDGPKYGDPDQVLTYFFKTADYEEQDLYYIVDWGDGTTTETDYVQSNTTVQLSHSWDAKDDYNITAQAVDIHGKPSLESEGYHIRIGDEPPVKPDIDGPINGPAGVEIYFDFTGDDPEYDKVSFNIKWGDGNEIPETEYYNSGESVTISHVWQNTGTYIVQARAKDIFDYWSDWGSYEIKIPRTKVYNYNIIELLFERFPNAFPILRHIFGL
ncbi:MAG: hypothetical protein JSU91_07390 [Thermoplasmatales archaeon]|nr:MAG: hypothetical protein JSU91_07390 [Thermoplasmatales archaeon]